MVQTIRANLELQPTGRPAKSTTAITQKLQREHIRLSQIQDIAGCRVIVGDIAEQEEAATLLQKFFPSAALIDRRRSPSHGYRAIHMVVSLDGKLIEIQVRTALQHLWAEISEKFSDVVEPAIKYGGGDSEIQRLLSDASALVSKIEFFETHPQRLSDIETAPRMSDLLERRDELAVLKKNIQLSFSQLISALEKTNRSNA